MTNNMELLLKGISSLIGCDVVYPTPNLNEGQNISFIEYNEIITKVTPTDIKITKDMNNLSLEDKSSYIEVKMKCLSGAVIKLTVSPKEKISNLKLMVSNEDSNLIPMKQRFIFKGTVLNDEKTLEDYGIKSFSTIHVVLNGLIVLKDVLNQIPCGWMRYGLKVKYRFGLDNSWIGSDSNPLTWPCSYHASLDNETQTEISNLISKSNNVNDTPTGIVTTNRIETAQLHAKKFLYMNKTYCIVFQNRVNPNTIREFNTPNGTYWVSPSIEDVRPYSICIKLVD
eukprot:gene2000-2462_t